MNTWGLKSVAEIGGGLGGTAVQAIRAGLPSYTIFDLPVILLVQAGRGCALLSINQEARGSTDTLEVRQLWVHDQVRREPTLRCVARHPNWHRRGYVEELFLPTARLVP